MVIITTTTMIVGRLGNKDVEGNDNANGSRFLFLSHRFTEARLQHETSYI